MDQSYIFLLCWYPDANRDGMVLEIDLLEDEDDIVLHYLSFHTSLSADFVVFTVLEKRVLFPNVHNRRSNYQLF